MPVICQLGQHTLVKDVNSHCATVQQLSESLKVGSDLFYVLHNGKKVQAACFLEDGTTYHFVPRVLGGKGGFGSMLRAIGAQIEKTTSREACRDLSGRRMRDVNNEKNLKEWLAKEADREREREERKQERLARRLAGPKHNFDDPEYHKQRSKVQEDLDDALKKGLKRANGQNERGASSSKHEPAKKFKTSDKEWFGIDVDSDDLDSDSDNEANPGSPNMPEVDRETPMESCTSAPVCSASSEDSGRDIKPDDKSEIDKDVQSLPSENGTSCVSNSPNAQIKEEIVKDDEPIDLSQVENTDHLMAMGLERLKNSLMSRGLKCGGTVEERAQRLFSVKGLSPDQIPPSLFAKSKGGGKKSK